MATAPTHTIVETVAFTRRLAKLGVSDTERAEILDQYAKVPAYGKVCKGTGGLRKGRLAKDDTGKSGGYRVFSFYLDANNPVFLVWIIDKSEDDSLTDEQEAIFKQLAKRLKEACR